MAESKVIIIGSNGHEYARIKPKNKKKRYFETKNQLYRVYPEGFTRMRVTHIDGSIEYAECVIYDENCIVPYCIPSKTMDYSSEAFMEDIWLDKQQANDYLKKRLSWQNVGSFLQQYGKYLPFVLIGGIVVIAFIGQWLGGN